MADRKAFLLRIDPGLWADLETWAADELRSVNGQIEYILKQAVARRKGVGLSPAAGLGDGTKGAPPGRE
jgi:hypothetical protein